MKHAILGLVIGAMMSLPAFAGEVLIKGDGINEQIITGKPAEIWLIASDKSEYPTLRFADKDKNVMGMITCHEDTSSGAAHNHCSWYAGSSDWNNCQASSCRKSILDIEFGNDWQVVSVESRFRIKSSAGQFEFRGENGSYYKLAVDSNDDAYLQRVDSDGIAQGSKLILGSI